jgi:hypothetical protein
MLFLRSMTKELLVGFFDPNDSNHPVLGFWLGPILVAVAVIVAVVAATH